MTKIRSLAFLAFSSILAAGAVIACGDDEEVTPTPTVDGGNRADTGTGADTGTDPAAPGTVKGKTTYAGAKTGAIYIALFKQISPFPDGLGGATAVLQPTLPGSNDYSVTNVPAGTYFVTGYIGTPVQGPPPGPVDGDPVAVPTQVTVTAGGTVTQDVLFIDPPPAGDGGTDGSAEGGSDGGADADAAL